MRVAIILALLATFLVGLVTMTAVMKGHLLEWDEPTIASLLKKRTPDARKRAKRFFLGLALCCVSLSMMLWLGPVKL